MFVSATSPLNSTVQYFSSLAVAANYFTKRLSYVSGWFVRMEIEQMYTNTNNYVSERAFEAEILTICKANIQPTIRTFF